MYNTMRANISRSLILLLLNTTRGKWQLHRVLMLVLPSTWNFHLEYLTRCVITLYAGDPVWWAVADQQATISQARLGFTLRDYLAVYKALPDKAINTANRSPPPKPDCHRQPFHLASPRNVNNSPMKSFQPGYLHPNRPDPAWSNIPFGLLF